MRVLFYLAGAVAVVATLLTVTRRNAVHALLYLIVSLLAVAAVLFAMGAPFVAALEVVIYAGAVMVLFVFVVMMLNLGERSTRMEAEWVRPRVWIGPGILALALAAEVVAVLARSSWRGAAAGTVGPREVGLALFGPYAIAVELASLLLMGGLVGAYHLGRRTNAMEEEVGNGGRAGGARDDPGGDPVRGGSGGAPRET